MPTEATDYQRRVAAVVLRVMRKHGELPFASLLTKVNGDLEASAPSMRKALRWLRSEHDAPLHYEAGSRRWVLERRDFSLPLLDPTADDVVAVAFASALLSPLGDASLNQRIAGLLAELDERAASTGQSRRLRSHAVTASSSAMTAADPKVVVTLARAVGTAVVRLRYLSPWAEDPTEKSHLVEPWQLRVHDSVLYLRAYSRRRKGPATFRVSQVRTAVVTGDAPTEPRPPAGAVWGAAGPTADVDIDRPDTAVVRIRGGMARYAASECWHADQHDRWLDGKSVLERSFDYASCRSLARRLLMLGDALISVRPPALREQVRLHAQALASATTDASGDG